MSKLYMTNMLLVLLLLIFSPLSECRDSQEVLKNVAIPTRPPATKPSLRPSTPRNLPTSVLVVPPTVKPSASPVVSAYPMLRPTKQPNAVPSTAPAETVTPSLSSSKIPTQTHQLDYSGPVVSSSTFENNSSVINPLSTVKKSVRYLYETSYIYLLRDILPAVGFVRTYVPSGKPSSKPSGHPSSRSTDKPSDQSSLSPTSTPSASPSVSPSSSPSSSPSASPSQSPTITPSASPSVSPSSSPSSSPSASPSQSPTSTPSASPSVSPSSSPSSSPSGTPSQSLTSYRRPISILAVSTRLSYGNSSGYWVPRTVGYSRNGAVLVHLRGPGVTVMYCQAQCMYNLAYRKCESVLVSYEAEAGGVVGGGGCSLLSSVGSLVYSAGSAVWDLVQVRHQSPGVQPSALPSSSSPSVSPSQSPTSTPSASPSVSPSSKPSFTAGLTALVTTYNWQTLMVTSKNAGTFTILTTGTAPDVVMQLASAYYQSTTTSVYYQYPIHQRPYFVCSFQLFMSGSNSQHELFFYAGASSPVYTGVSSLGNSGNAIVIGFDVYSSYSGGAGRTGPGIYLNNGASTIVASAPFSGNSAWDSVTITYTQGTTNTWVVSWKGVTVLTYSDPNNANWVSTTAANKYWGFGARAGDVSGDFYIRGVSLSYPSTQPTGLPSGQPTGQPSSQPTGQPSGSPSIKPTYDPSSQPTSQPSGQPSNQPSGEPSGQPTMQPTGQPSSQPTGQPSGQPTSQPTSQPSGQPTAQPSSNPTGQTLSLPSEEPSQSPTSTPSLSPSVSPSLGPSSFPTASPTADPTKTPTLSPTSSPSTSPSNEPTPSANPTANPTVTPTSSPTAFPTTIPSTKPSLSPTTSPTARPTATPTTTFPTNIPSIPTSTPSTNPTTLPTRSPTFLPTFAPTVSPTTTPTAIPSHALQLNGYVKQMIYFGPNCSDISPSVRYATLGSCTKYYSHGVPAKLGVNTLDETAYLYLNEYDKGDSMCSKATVKTFVAVKTIPLDKCSRNDMNRNEVPGDMLLNSIVESINITSPSGGILISTYDSVTQCSRGLLNASSFADFYDVGCVKEESSKGVLHSRRAYCNTSSSGHVRVTRYFFDNTKCSGSPVKVLVNNTGPACYPGSNSTYSKIQCVSPVCPGGAYSVAGSTECRNCTAGSFALHGASRCENCTAGTFSRSGADQCSPCSPGTFSGVGVGTCCSAGQFAGFGATTCATCPSGTYSQAGAMSCSVCPAGTHSGAGSSGCLECKAGQFSKAKAPTCSNCSMGSYSTVKSASCSMCPPGSYQPYTGSGFCKICPAGKFSLRNASTCTVCPAGSSSPQNSTTCTVCPAGTYSGPGSGVCSQCSVGTYSLANSSTCLSCPPGSYSLGNAGFCEGCAAGTYQTYPRSSLCPSCPLGRYSSRNATECTNCAAGLFANTTGSASCKACRPGTYSLEGQSNCSSCAVMTYSHAAASNCTSCGVGQYSLVASSHCCNLGYYYLPSNSTCRPCAAGQSGSASGTCTNCPANTYSAAGAASCNACPTDSVSTAGAATCICSVAGQYQSGFGSNLTCTPCDFKYYSAIAGVTSCTPCPLGGSISGTGNTQCPLCPIGSYSIEQDISLSCELCGTGKTTATAGATDSAQCVNTTLSFSAGLILLPIGAFLALFYIWTGRIHVIAALRRIRWTRKCVYVLNRLYEELRIFEDQRDSQRRPRNRLRAIAFILIGVVLFLTVVVASLVMLLHTLLFSAMILARAFVINDFTLNLSRWVMKLDVVIPNFHLVFYPVEQFLTLLFSLRIDLSAVALSCSGANAPIELYINIAILFFIVVIIEGDYQLFLSPLLTQTVRKYFGILLRLLRERRRAKKVTSVVPLPLPDLQEYHEDRRRESFDGDDTGANERRESTIDNIPAANVLLTTGRIRRPSIEPALRMMRRAPIFKRAAVASIDTSRGRLDLIVTLFLRIVLLVNPLLILLRYAMTFIRLQVFVGADGRHDSTAACDVVTGLLHIDTIIAYIATFFAYLIFLPGFYTLVCVVHPGVPSESLTGSRESYGVILRTNTYYPFEGRFSFVFTWYRRFCRIFVSWDFPLLNLLHAWSQRVNKRIHGEVYNRMTFEELELDAIFVADEELNKWEQEWEPPPELPFYNDLVQQCRDQMSWGNYTSFHDVMLIVKTFWALTPMGQLSTKVGRYCWLAMLWKFMSFMLVSIGVWTQGSVDGYQLKEKAEEYMSKEEVERRDMIFQFVASIVGLRSVFWMIVPQMTLLSVYCFQTGATPIFVFAKDVSHIFPDMIAFDAWKLARLSSPNVLWKAVLLSISNFISQSRAIQLIVSLSTFVLIIGITFTSPTEQTSYGAIILCVTVLNSISSAIYSLINIGDFLGVQDADFTCRPDQSLVTPPEREVVTPGAVMFTSRRFRQVNVVPAEQLHRIAL